MLVGYARVSTQDQNLGLQKGALEKVGCEIELVSHLEGRNIGFRSLTEFNG